MFSSSEWINLINKQSVESEVLAALKGEWYAFFKGDFDDLARYWMHAPDTRRMISGPQVGTRHHVGWDEIGPRLKSAMEAFPQNYDPDEWLRWDNLVIHTDTKIAWVSYNQIMTKHRENISAAGLQYETKILHRVAAGWKIACQTVIIPATGRDDVPQIELDDIGRVVRINEIARSRLKNHPGLIVSANRLKAKIKRLDPEFQSALKRTLSQLFSTHPPSVYREHGIPAVNLGEDDFGHPMHCWLSVEHNRLLVTFDDSYLAEKRLDDAKNVLSLSPAQRELATHLVKGSDLSSIADNLGVSINTVRTQLRRMFEKTGTHSQSALVSALLTIHQPT